VAVDVRCNMFKAGARALAFFFISRRNRRERRKFYSLTLMVYISRRNRRERRNGGLRPCAASQL